MKKQRTPEKITLSSIAKSIDTLAIMTKRGFDDVGEFKKDMTEFAQKTGVTLFNLDSNARTTNERLDAIEKILGPVVHLPQVMQREFREHDRRIALLEKKVGLVK